MTKKILGSGGLAGAIAGLLLLAPAGGAADLSFLDRKIPVFEVGGQPMAMATTQLLKAGVAVCFEEVELDAARDRTVDPQTREVHVHKKTFSLRMENASVKEILDALVRADGEYVWQADSQNRLVEVLPGTVAADGVTVKSVLDWQPSIARDLKGKRLDLIAQDLGVAEHGIYLLWLDTNDALNRGATLRAQSAPVRSILNQLLSAEPKLCWSLGGFRGTRALSCVPCGR